MRKLLSVLTLVLSTVVASANTPAFDAFSLGAGVNHEIKAVVSNTVYANEKQDQYCVGMDNPNKVVDIVTCYMVDYDTKVVKDIVVYTVAKDESVAVMAVYSLEQVTDLSSGKTVKMK